MSTSFYVRTVLLETEPEVAAMALADFDLLPGRLKVKKYLQQQLNLGHLTKEQVTVALRSDMISRDAVATTEAALKEEEI